jgi:HlyD family secretion protein
MTASVEIKTNTKNNVLSVPLASVTTRIPGSGKKKRGRRGGGKPQTNDQAKKKKKNKQPQEVVFVYDSKTKKVSKRKVKTGISDFENIEILKGLKEGEEVVTGPFAVVSKRLKDKELVKKTDKDSKGRD